MKVFAFLISILATSALFGQMNSDALTLLQEVEKQGLKYKTIESGLTYVLENKAEGTNEKVSGLIQVKGSMFKLDIDQTVTFCDGKVKWVVLEESNEVNITEIYDLDDMLPEERFMNSPLSVYSMYKSDFKYMLFGEADLEGVTYVMVDLTPKSLDKPYFKIRYWISPDKDIYAVKYFQKDGMRISLYFDNFVGDKKIDDEEFIFKEGKYPGIEVIDLR